MLIRIHWVQRAEYAAKTGFTGKNSYFPHNKSSGGKAVPESIIESETHVSSAFPSATLRQLALIFGFSPWDGKIAIIGARNHSKAENGILCSYISFLISKPNTSQNP